MTSSDHFDGVDAPVRALNDALAANEIASSEFRTLRLGESMRLVVEAWERA